MAAIEHKDIGDVWEPQATFTVAGTATDPTTVTVLHKNAGGTVTTLGPVDGATGGGGITRVSAGVYKITVTLDTAGYWKARFEGTGAAAAAEDHEIIVDPSEFYADALLDTRALVGLAETKDWLEHNNVDTSDDLKIVQRINAASETIYETSGYREFTPEGTVAAPATRTFDLDPWNSYKLNGYRVADVGDLTSVTAATISSDLGVLLTTLAPSGYTLLPRVRKPWEPYQQIRFAATVSNVAHGNQLELTGIFGFPAVPENIKHVCMELVASYMDRDVEHFRQDMQNVAGEEGGSTIILGARPFVLPLPPEHYAVVKGYRNPLVG